MKISNIITCFAKSFSLKTKPPRWATYLHDKSNYTHSDRSKEHYSGIYEVAFDTGGLRKNLTIASFVRNATTKYYALIECAHLPVALLLSNDTGDRLHECDKINTEIKQWTPPEARSRGEEVARRAVTEKDRIPPD